MGRMISYSTTAIMDDENCISVVQEEKSVEDKATSTDDELLTTSPPPDKTQDVFFTSMARAAQMWGADLVGLNPQSLAPPPRGRYLRHQGSLSSNSDVSKPRTKLRKQRTMDSPPERRRTRTRKLRRQWTTDSSDSGYSKGYSRERLKRQDTEESHGSSHHVAKDLQRQTTLESTSSLRLTRQSSFRSSSDNQSFCLPRQSTFEDDALSEFSMPQSSISGIRLNPPQRNSMFVSPFDCPPITNLPTTASCSLINLNTVEIEASKLTEIRESFTLPVKMQEGDTEAPRRRSRNIRKKDELPKRVRWSIIATGLVLLFMSVILVGATLRMAPLIDEMVRKENESILKNLRTASTALTARGQNRTLEQSHRPSESSSP